MTTDEKLDLLLSEMQGMKSEMQGMKSDIRNMNQRMDGLELQLKSTERTLKNEIKKSESLILDEVERVHMILDNHIHDTSKHIA